MSRISIPNANKYKVRPTRRQALRSLITGKPLVLTNKQVTVLIEFGVGVHDITVECWGGGGGGGGGASSVS